VIQPQSNDEVSPVEAQLRRLDSGLRIRWNPKARHRRQAHYNVEGELIVDESYEGRWQVVKLDVQDARPDEPAIIYTLEFDGSEGGREEHGTYRAVGDWLVEFMRKWDSANSHFREEWEKEWAGHDALLKQAEVWQDEAAALEGLDRMWVQASERRTHYPGRGADFNA